MRAEPIRPRLPTDGYGPGHRAQLAGASRAIPSTDWKGPYLDAVVNDPVSGAGFNYSVTSPTVAKVTSSATATPPTARLIRAGNRQLQESDDERIPQGFARIALDLP